MSAGEDRAGEGATGGRGRRGPERVSTDGAGVEKIIWLIIFIV